MKSIRFNVSALWRSFQLFVAACACAFMLFSNVAPAYSLPNPFATDDKTEATTSPTKGEDNLLGIEEGAQKAAIRQDDLDLLSLENVQQKSSEGINEIQGAADINNNQTNIQTGNNANYNIIGGE